MADRIFTKSLLAGLTFPVARIKTVLRGMKYAERVTDKSAVCLTAMLQYITAEVLEGAINAANSDSSKRIQPKHINMALKNDPETNVNFENSIITNAAVVGLDHSAALLDHYLNVESRIRRRPRKKKTSSTKKASKKRVRNSSNSTENDNYELLW